MRRLAAHTIELEHLIFELQASCGCLFLAQANLLKESFSNASQDGLSNKVGN